MSHSSPQKDLSPAQRDVLFNKGTEAPFSGALLHNTADGTYHCANCGSVVFNSQDKYDSTTPGLIGWPSFSAAASRGAVRFEPDNSLAEPRTEVLCATCGAHLGHVFEADDSPSGQHYCINSVALDFKKGSKNTK